MTLFISTLIPLLVILFINNICIIKDCNSISEFINKKNSLDIINIIDIFFIIYAIMVYIMIYNHPIYNEVNNSQGLITCYINK